MFLKGILKNLKNGEQLVLSYFENAFGEAIDTALVFNNGTWEVKQLNCISASSQGLGTCACNSHDTYVYDNISRKEALELIRQYIEEVQQEEQKQKEELKFLDNLISLL